MWSQGTTQGAKASIPPIPKVDAGQAAASTGESVREIVRQAVSDVRAEVRQARDAGKAAPVVAQAPQGGIPTTAPPPREFNANDDIPPQVMNLLNMSMVFVAVLVLGLPIIRMFARRFDRKTEAIRSVGPDIMPQLRQLQDSVDTMAIEVERISEGQRFTSKLLADRSARVSVSGE